jgi:hypothetical protein
MQEKMKRFLESIGIVDAERFDLDFDLVARDPYERNKVNMHIAKNSPWDYSALEEFQEGLTRATYPIDSVSLTSTPRASMIAYRYSTVGTLSVYHGIPAF